ncbi:MAG: hypothetical protein Kow0056_16730 [Coriobacteriia bacterium]
MLAVAAVWVTMAVSTGPLLAAAPHVVPLGESDTDVCAMCHRAHSSASETSWTDSYGVKHTSALIVGVPTENGDAGLCFACHGTELLGSGTDVLSAFSSASTHTLSPGVSPFGPAQKQCSSCHDSHGQDRRGDGSTYPALLRTQDTSVTGPSGRVFSGEEYCAACHKVRTGESWDGLAVFRQTAHGSSVMTAPTGADIRCSACHNPHGSDYEPLIAAQVVPPSAAATVTVYGNDRTLCFACHTASQDTYAGKAGYDDSSHGQTDATTTVAAAWASAETSRPVGECQSCHAPMGRDDGAGDAIPEMLQVDGRALCDGCHDADGPASSDVSATAYPASATSDLEVVASVVPSTPTEYEARLQVYSRETSGSTPALLVGPREYEASVEASAIAIGDVDGDGRNELVVADPTGARLDLLRYDALRGLDDATGAGSLSIAATADLLAVGDVILDASGLPEIAVVDRGAGQLRLYRYDSGSLTLVDGPISVGNDPSSLAAGDVTGTAAPDLVVTAKADDQFRILTESAGSLSVSGPFNTRSKPQGASTGDAWAGGTKDEIVIVNEGEAVNRVSVFDGSGGLLGDGTDSAPSGSVPVASVVSDVLPGVTPAGTSGAEVCVVYRNDGSGSDSAVAVFPQLAGGGLDTPLEYNTGTDARSGDVAAGDVDGDGRSELLVSNAGRWSRSTDRQMAAVLVLRANAGGTALTSVETKWAGGTELAGGSAPDLAVGDLGPVGRSRHAIGGAPDTHVSTETAGATRHVECVDCHEVHEATSTVAAAPAAYGVIKGAWGVSVTNVSTSSITLTEKRGVDYEYELCFKCHAGWVELDGSADLSFQFNPLNPGEHAVEETSTDAQANSGTYETGWGNDSVLFCVDCHGNSVSNEATGPHSSNASPLLKRPYLGTRTVDAALLCYECHKYSVYYSGVDDTGTAASGFRDVDLAASRQKLHAYHSGTMGYGCAACHVSHGSPTEEHLVRGEVSYSHAAAGGSCANDCHTGGASRTYTRP